MANLRQTAADPIRKRTPTARGDRTRRRPLPPIPTPGSTAKGVAGRPGCASWEGLIENRHGLLVEACLTLADGHAERPAHDWTSRRGPRAITLGADKAYDAQDFINELRFMTVTPYVAQNTNGRRSAIDHLTTRDGRYAVSQRIRKRIEEAFGWIKTVAGQEKTKLRGYDRVGWVFTFAAAAYNLVRLPKLLAGPK